VLQLALHHAACPLDVLQADGLIDQQVDDELHRRERVAQLVGQHFQALVAVPVGVFGMRQRASQVIGGGGEPAEVADEPRILRVEAMGIVVGHHPDRSHRLAFERERHQQRLDDRRPHRGKVFEMAFEVRKQVHRVAVDHRAAGAERAGRGISQMRRELALERAPAEVGAVLLDQADARGSGAARGQRRLRQALQDQLGRVRHALRQRRQDGGFGGVIRGARRSLPELRRADDGIQTVARCSGYWFVHGPPFDFAASGAKPKADCVRLRTHRRCGTAPMRRI